MGDRRGYRFAGFELWPDQARLLRDGQELSLQPRLLDLLRHFVERPGQLLLKQDLLLALWPDAPVNEEALTQAVKRLRRLLDDDAEAPRFVETVPRRGYRFVAAVEPFEPGEAAPAPPFRAARPARPVAASLAAALGLAALLVSGWQALRPPPLAPLSAGHLQRLTFFPEREMGADLSPDGRSFVFVSQHAAPGQFDLYLAPLSEPGAARRLTRTPEEEFAPRFAPDGRSLLVSRNAGPGWRPSLWQLPLDGSSPARRLVEEGGLGDWSPDGREIAFLRRQAGGGRSVVRRRLADGAERELAQLPGSSEDSLAWSPDGRFVGLVSERRALLLPAHGGAARVVVEGVQTLAFTPDGRGLIVDGNWGGRSNLWQVSLDGRQRRPLTSGASVHRYPVVARDGRRVLYTNEQWQWLLQRFDRQGAPLERVGARASVASFGASRDGRSVVYEDLDAGLGENPVRWLGLESGSERELGPGLGPALSPDGRRVALVRRAGAAAGLWVVALAGEAPRRIHAGLVEPQPPAWSPSGAQVAFVARPGLHVVVSDGGGQARLVAAGAFAAPAFSPDGRWLAASGRCAEGPEGLQLVDVASGACRRLSPLASYEAAPLWEPDGSGLAVLVSERSQPTLVSLDLQGRERERTRFRVPDQAAFWGLFQVAPMPGGFLAQVQTVDADLYLLEIE